MRKSARKDTIQGALETVRSISKVVSPTCELTPDEMAHFDRVVKSREASSWSEHDLSIATQLARTLRRFDQLQCQLDEDGLTLVNEKGTKVAHPLLSASMTMANTIQSLTRTLGLSASQRALTGVEASKRNAADRSAREVIEKASDDSLLA